MFYHRIAAARLRHRTQSRLNAAPARQGRIELIHKDFTHIIPYPMIEYIA
jgi:hypothetical protein